MFSRIGQQLHYHKDNIYTHEPVSYRISYSIILTPMCAVNSKQHRYASLSVFFNCLYTG